MTMELSFCLVDCGDPFYKAAAHEMIRSARRVMPDLKITQISDAKTPMHPEVDGFIQASVNCDRERVTLFKGHFLGEYAAKTDSDLIMCDVDMVWNKGATSLFEDMGRDNPGLMYRDGFPSMPYNAGLMLSRGAHAWWRHYVEIIDDLDTHGMGTWYCDQIALSIAQDWGHRVTMFKMDEIAAAPDTMPIAPMDTYVTHFKGERKKWLFDYARMLENSQMLSVGTVSAPINFDEAMT